MNDQPHPEVTEMSDPWQIWFSRLVQVAGLGLVGYEAVVEKVDRPWLLLVAVSMMLGGRGLQLIVRAMTRGIQ